MKIERICKGYYEFENELGIKGTIDHMIDPEYKGSTVYGLWVVQTTDVNGYSDPVDTYREAKQIAEGWGA